MGLASDDRSLGGTQGRPHHRLPRLLGAGGLGAGRNDVPGPLPLGEHQHQPDRRSPHHTQYLDPKDSSLWWAGKELLREKALNAYTGKNEKTKILVKLTKAGSGAPVREPAMDEETRLKLMGMYHKKQEDMKKIDSTNEDDFSHSSWANPNNLKNQLVTGGKGVSFKTLK